jgi:hypothetical protein
VLALRATADILRVNIGTASSIQISRNCVIADSAAPPAIKAIPDLGPMAAQTGTGNVTVVDTSGGTSGDTWALKEFSAYNNGASTAFRVEVFDGTNTVIKWNGTLAGGEKLEYNEAAGTWDYYDAQGLLKTFTTVTGEAYLATAQSISAATYADLTGCSITLDPGTWLIVGHLYASAVNLAFLAHLALTDGANNIITEGSEGAAASGTASVNQWAHIGLCAVVVVTTQTSYKLRAARGLTTLTNSYTAQDGAGTNVANNASTGTDKGTGIHAIRIR